MIKVCPVLLTGFHEDALHGFPVVVLAGGNHAMYFSLAVDGASVLLPSDRQVDVCGSVSKANLTVPLPVVLIT